MFIQFYRPEKDEHMPRNFGVINRSKTALWRDNPKDDSMNDKPHAGLPVAGYKPQSASNVDKVNANKAAEEALLRVCDELKNDHHVDQRWLAVARTGFEQAFMALNRSIFRPGRISLPEDGQ